MLQWGVGVGREGLMGCGMEGFGGLFWLLGLSLLGCS